MLHCGVAVSGALRNMNISEEISTLSGRKLLSLGLKDFLWIFLAAIGPNGTAQLCSEWLLELDGSH